MEPSLIPPTLIGTAISQDWKLSLELARGRIVVSCIYHSILLYHGMGKDHSVGLRIDLLIKVFGVHGEGIHAVKIVAHANMKQTFPSHKTLF